MALQPFILPTTDNRLIPMTFVGRWLARYFLGIRPDCHPCRLTSNTMKFLVVLQIALLLGVGCHKDSRGERNRRMQATVLLDKTTVQLGDDLEIRITGVPAGWSGTMWVNSGRHRFDLPSTRYVLKATRENGFSVWAPTEIYFFLKDRPISR